jgi:5-methylcytosine-specific restriction endonuclease McrA
MAKPYRTLSNHNRPRKDSERKIKLDLESLVSQITRLRTPFCVLCGENNWRELECGHFWHRAMPPTEFDLQNLNTLCKSCNRQHESDPKPYRDYMLKTLGQKVFDQLERRAHSQTKMGYIEVFNLREEMRALLHEERQRVE